MENIRISDNSNMDAVSISKTAINNSPNVEKVVQQGSKTTSTTIKQPNSVEKVKSLAIDNRDETKAKVQEAVNTMNEMLEVNKNASKFLYHEGLERYYVTLVDRETEEVVKEIPPKKILDAYYEMQKMLGMIVDEKI